MRHRSRKQAFEMLQYQQRASKAFAAAASQRGLKPQRLAVKLELLLHAVEPLALVQYVLALEAFADDVALGGGARPCPRCPGTGLAPQSFCRRGDVIIVFKSIQTTSVPIHPSGANFRFTLTGKVA